MSPKTSEVDLEILRAFEYRRRHSDGEEGAWFGPIGALVRSWRGSEPDDDVEQEVSDSLAALELMGAVTVVGHTHDRASYPIFRATRAGVNLLLGHRIRPAF